LFVYLDLEINLRRACIAYNEILLIAHHGEKKGEGLLMYKTMRIMMRISGKTPEMVRNF
jgi:hypothetical protein